MVHVITLRMAFVPILGAEGKTTLIPAANATAFVRGNALVDNGAGLITNAAAGGNDDVHYVAMETRTTTTAGELLLCIRTKGVLFRADTDAAWAQTDVGVVTGADLAGAGTINPDATVDGVFFIERGVGTVAVDTQVDGFFTEGVPNS